MVNKYSLGDIRCFSQNLVWSRCQGHCVVWSRCPGPEYSYVMRIAIRIDSNVTFSDVTFILSQEIFLPPLHSGATLPHFSTIKGMKNNYSKQNVHNVPSWELPL